MNISRRQFLGAAVATSCSALIPEIALPAPVAQQVAPATTIWVGGHSGEFDWQPFNASSWRDAVKQLLGHHGFGNEEEIAAMMTLPDEELRAELKHFHMDVERARKMDGLQPDDIKPHHWIRAGLGACCSRCDSECYADNGGRAIGTEAVCEECLTLTDLIQGGGKWDLDQAEEQLVELMIDEDCDEGAVFAILSKSNDMSVITPAFWTKCLGEARKYV
ncbi:hypothetical protein J2J97_32115 (plasmid) [Rhizobium bangladeshense]|uniref:hypothetical protein n=1 Tax=Rhizobium bangladeshense TaxID=1138189 RepID=UPI001A9954F2|nr:hypothetical protein [Rhizobium bangladeshense]QSY98552.1 hypothetical protein J2J97_32115 [Rhizobium bangladeshense]